MGRDNPRSMTSMRVVIVVSSLKFGHCSQNFDPLGGDALVLTVACKDILEVIVLVIVGVHVVGVGGDPHSQVWQKY